MTGSSFITLHSPRGNHARVDGFVSLGVIASAIVLALGARSAIPSSAC
jgi:hypothetical protein